jgi:hypothetical protein
LLSLVGRRTSRPPHIGLASYLFSVEISSANDPGRTFAVLRRRENAIGNETADGGWAEREDCDRLFDCCLAAVGMLAVTINGDVVLMAQGANTPVSAGAKIPH